MSNFNLKEISEIHEKAKSHLTWYIDLEHHFKKSVHTKAIDTLVTMSKMNIAISKMLLTFPKMKRSQMAKHGKSLINALTVNHLAIGQALKKIRPHDEQSKSLLKMLRNKNMEDLKYYSAFMGARPAKDRVKPRKIQD